MGTVRIRQITLSRKQLNGIPDVERRLLVLMAHAGNELNVLSKLFHFSARAKFTTPILAQSENTQSLVLGRVLTGKIYECWKLLQTAFFSSVVAKSYQGQFDAEALEALEGLKRYFGRANAIATVRNKHAFHYSPEQVDAGCQALIDDDPLEIYLAQSNANTLYTFADTIAGRAMLESIQPGDHKGAFETLIDETTRAVGLMNTVIGTTMAICLNTHLGDDWHKDATLLDIYSVPNSQTVSIPYFVDTEEK